MRATFNSGLLDTLNNKCTLDIPGFNTIQIKILPEVSDSKSARYVDDPVIGRSTPYKTYAHSDNRVLGIKFHFQAVVRAELGEIAQNFYAISSLTYPRKGSANGPYAPPPICKFSCGKLLGTSPLCLVLDNYSLSIPTDVVWDDETLIPYYFMLQTSWHVVYASSNLPSQERIIGGGV